MTKPTLTLFTAVPVWLSLLLSFSNAAAEQPAPPSNPPDAFEEHLRFQSAMEIEVGLRFYEEGDDYRAITALKRYRLLADDAGADHLAMLLVGDIYRRNQHSEIALRYFWDASRAASHLSPHHRLASYHLGLQELCVSLAAYLSCHPMLRELEQHLHAEDLDELADLSRYHRQFVAFVLRSPPTEWEPFADPRLQRAAADLAGRQALFEALPLKSPALAGILSAVLPGAGQAYLGRWADAALAFVFTGIFAGATAYSHYGLQSLPLTITSGLFTLGFYGGNIANAVTDARRINATRYEDFFDALHQDLWPRLYLRVDHSDVSYDYRFDWPGIHDPKDAEPPPLPELL